MKKLLFALAILFLCWQVSAQRVQTIVPKQPVVVGNAFQVQYIVTDPSSLANIFQPAFENFRLVSGPNRFKGNALIDGRMQAIENITFTLVPLKTGKVNVEGIAVNFKSGQEKSTNETITVIPQPKASFNSSSSYTDVNLYAPSSKSDLDKLIAENLFVKADVDRRTCFLGEPIIATFKLYSRLQSTSEVINAPSLYGFSVMDMLNINEAHQSVETINGKVFNTYVLRKLQLYPEQTGKLLIDPMQLQNEIEFDDSVKGTKTKIEKFLATAPIEVNIKPLPGKEPDDFTGAIGNFIISSSFAKNKIPADQQGKLILIIRGKGNFIQFGPPAVSFPKSFDVFDPSTSDHLNKNVAPTEGERKYVFSFTTDSVGIFTLAPVPFIFFDPVSLQYKKVQSDSIRFEVLPAAEKITDKSEPEKVNRSGKPVWITILLMAVIAATVFGSWKFLRKKPKQNLPSAIESPPDYLQKFQEISTHVNEKQVCLEIQQLLSEVKTTAQLSWEQQKEISDIQNECQLFIYSDISIEGKSEELKKRTLHLLRQMEG